MSVAGVMAARVERAGHSVELNVVLGRGYRVRTSWVRHGAVISYVQRGAVSSC